MMKECPTCGVEISEPKRDPDCLPCFRRDVLAGKTKLANWPEKVWLIREK